MLARDTRVLILGSFPGEASLAAQQYYAHPRNHFWPLVGTVLGVPLAAMPYRSRIATLRARGLGLWDVIVACERRGSLDGAIRNAEHGEIDRARRIAKSLALVCFNGRTAGARRAGVARRRLPDARAAVVVARVYAAFRREARRVAGDRRACACAVTKAALVR